MTEEALSRDQLKFLEELNFEFCDRFTDADVEYKKIYDAGIPPPPIMFPWQRRNRFNNRDRSGGSRYNERDYGNNPRDYGNHPRGYGNNPRGYGGSRHDSNYNHQQKRSYDDRETQHYSRFRPF